MSFSPQNPPSGSGTLVAHWAARLDTGYSDNDSVGTFNAQSGTSFDATQGTGANQPTYKEDIINGQPVFRFDGGDYLTSGALADFKFLHDGTDWTVFIVYATSTSQPDTNYRFLDTLGGGSANIGTTLSFDDRSGVTRNEQIRVFIAKGSSGNPIIDSGTGDDAVISGEFQVLTYRYDFGGAGDDFIINVDGVQAASLNPGNLPHSTSNPNNVLTVGGDGDPGVGSLVGDLAEILIYTSALSVTDRLYIEDGLRGIYYQAVPNSFAPIDEAGDYDALGFHVVKRDGTIHFYGRRGTIHGIEKAGKIRKWTSINKGSSWSQADIVDNADYDDRNLAGGIVSATDTHILFYGRYDVDGAAWHDIRALRSTDGGDTWNDQGAIPTGSGTTFSPFGPLVELPSGKLMITYSSRDESTQNRLIAIFSSDDGVSWGSAVDIEDTLAFRPTEAAAVFVSGASDAAANLLLVCRDLDGAMRQYKSTNGGAGWTDMGALPFSSGTNTDVSPWVCNDGSYIHLIYGDRSDWTLRHVWGVGADILSSVNNWINPQIIHYFGSTNAGDQAYPSISQTFGEWYITFHDDSTDTSNESDIYVSPDFVKAFMHLNTGVWGP